MRLDFYSYHHIVMLPIPEKRPSVLKMSEDFATYLLRSLGKSEATKAAKGHPTKNSNLSYQALYISQI